MTTKQDIRHWLETGKAQGSTHVIVVCDTYDYEDYPIYVSSHENVNQVASKYDGKNMQKIMEVYNLSMDIKEQLTAHRAVNY